MTERTQRSYSAMVLIFENGLFSLKSKEGEIVFQTLIEHVPEIQLESDEFEWREMFALRALEKLPVSF